MIEIELETRVEEEGVTEEVLNKVLLDSIIPKIVESLDDIAFVDMEMDEENRQIVLKASLVICSKQDIATNAQLQAQEMSRMGLNEEQILRVLEIGISTVKGF